MKGSALGWQHDLTINTYHQVIWSVVFYVYMHIYIYIYQFMITFQSLTVNKNVRFPGIPALRNGWMHPKDWPLMDQDLRAKLMQKWSPTQKCVLLGKTEGPACCIISYHLLAVELGEASIHKPSTGKRTSNSLSFYHLLPMFWCFIRLFMVCHPKVALARPCHAGVPISRSHRREAMGVEAGDQAISQGQSN